MQDDLTSITADIVMAYAATHTLSVEELTGLITSTHAALVSLGQPPAEVTPVQPSAAAIRKSVTSDAITSFIDGRAYKTLRRHLSSRGLTPEDYRARYGLPFDYPMTAETYRQARVDLAKSLGLGKRNKGPRPARK